MVDDGSCGSYGKEIEFRSNLENELRKGKSNFYYKNRRLNSKRKKKISTDNDILVEESNDEDCNEIKNEELKTGIKKDFIPMVLIVVNGLLTFV